MSTNYRASSAAAITLASLASSSSLTVGRVSTAISNAAFRDDFLMPYLRVRSGSTAPTAGGQIEFWAFAQRADGAWPELFTAAYVGTDDARTVVSRDILVAGAVLLGVVTNDATTGRDYVIRGRELAMAFGAVPKEIGFFVTQSTGQNLDSTGGNHALTVNPGNYA
jgi:hypothetical protein